MHSIKKLILISGLAVGCFSGSVSGGEKKNSAVSQPKPDYELPQPQKEQLDYRMYQRIREEGLEHSHVMEYASGLIDGIGSRLTGSPNARRANEWTSRQLAGMGCSNVHLEDWGEFGLGWQQLNASIRMVSPDTAVLIGQAGPWSPSTSGSVVAPAILLDIRDERDLEKYKDQLSGKIVLLGSVREVVPPERPLFKRFDAADLKELSEDPLKREDEREQFQLIVKRLAARERIGKFLADAHASALLIQSRDGREGSGSGGIVFDDLLSTVGWLSYTREHASPLPIMILAVEHYGRIYRLLKAGVPVQVELNIETKFTGDHEHGFNTIAEIPGTDPSLADQAVMLGAHLDSWAAGTGATDNGAGTVITMEAMRILKALQVRPRRTIRVALWTGEEQGELGSYAYVQQHFGYIPRSTAPDQFIYPETGRDAAGPIQFKSAFDKISVYFNLDNGGGKIRGIYLQGNAAAAPIFDQWSEPLKDLGVSTLSMRNANGTDHEAFDAIGIPGFQFIQDPLDYGSRTHHSNMDVYERLLPQDLAQAAVVEATFVYDAAMRDRMLPRKATPDPQAEKQRSAPLKNVMPRP